MNAIVFHAVINRLVISPFVENVQVDYAERTASFDINVPLFASRPNVPPMFDQYVGAMMGNLGSSNVLDYWRSYVKIMLMPYTNVISIDCAFKNKADMNKISFTMSEG